MADSNKLLSLQVEKHALSAFLKHPEIFPDLDGFLREDDFTNSSNKNIFAVIRAILSKSLKIDKVLVAQKMKNLGLVNKEDVDIFGYLDALATSQITAEGGRDACKELVKLRVRREICENAEKVKEFVVKNGELKIDELIAGADKIYNDKLNQYAVEDEPKDLYGGIEEILNERGAQPQNELGLITPFLEFNTRYGGIRSGNGIYVITSRAKEGKSSFLLNMAQGVTVLNEDTICLYLDTEMQTEVSQFRAASANSGVPMWYLETGNFSRNKELAAKVKEILPEFNKYKKKIYHLNVVNKPIQEICNQVRRFYYKNVGRLSGRRMLLIYDYIKLTGEKLGNNYSETQAVGDKVNYLNELGNHLNIPIWSAAQSNRGAEDGRDDSSIVATSDRIFWFCAYLGQFRKKRLEELSADGLEFGSHLLKTFAARFMGKEANSNDYVNIGTPKKPKYEQNYINYHLDNFRIEERGTLQDVIDKQRQIINLAQNSVTTGGSGF